MALQLGYSSAEEDVRAAILGQFPALTLGGSYNKDTSDVISAGPTLDFGLPVFDRNQGHIANAAATRVLLRAQYQARLDICQCACPCSDCANSSAVGGFGDGS